MFGTEKLSRVLWCQFLDIWFLVHLTINSFIFDFGRLHFLKKTTGQCSHLVHFDFCHYVIEYLMRDMMNYHRLRVFRRRIKRIGKHSPGYIYISIPECMAVPMLSCAVFRSRAPSGGFFFLPISISHARQVVNEVGRFSLTDGVE